MKGHIKKPVDLMKHKYGTQEEDVVKNWLLSEYDKNGTSLLESRTSFSINMVCRIIMVPDPKPFRE